MRNVTRPRSASKGQEELKFEMTPMIDVTFLILIFFMCTLQFKTLEGKLAAFLPTSQGLNTASEPLVETEKVRLTLRVHPDGRLRSPSMRRVQVSSPASRTPLGLLHPTTREGNTEFGFRSGESWARLRAYVASVRAVDPQAAAILDAAPDVPHGAATLALDALHSCGFTDIAFAGIPKRLMQELQSRKVRCTRRLRPLRDLAWRRSTPPRSVDRRPPLRYSPPPRESRRTFAADGRSATSLARRAPVRATPSGLNQEDGVFGQRQCPCALGSVRTGGTSLIDNGSPRTSGSGPRRGSGDIAVAGTRVHG